MPRLDVLIGALDGPVWLAGAVAALVVIAAAFATGRSFGGGLLAGLLRIAAVIVPTVLVWVLIDRLAEHERLAERRAFNQRLAVVASQAIAPGSILACLDAMGSEPIETACEKAIFASPESVAASVSYTAMQLALLSEGTLAARRDGMNYEAALAPLRQSLEADRFGMVAHVLSIRDGCTPAQCDGLTLLQNRGRVEANLRDHTFETYVARHTAEWSARGRKAETPVADNQGEPQMDAAPTPLPPRPTGVPVSPKYDFPSAASIPPVSIMTPEPGTATATGASVTKPPTASANVPTPPRKPLQATRAAAPRSVNASVSAPQSLVPPASDSVSGSAQQGPAVTGATDADNSASR